MSRRVGIVLILILVLTLPQTPASTHGLDYGSNQGTQLPTASQIIERFLRAVGGRAAWLKIKSQYGTGTTEIPGSGKVTYEVYLKGRYKTLVVMKFAGGELRIGFDGQRSWSQTPRGGAQYDPPASQASSKRENDFYRYLNFNQHFPHTRVTGIEEVEGAKVYVVEATAASEKIPERLYFDINTGILVRRDITREDSEGKRTTRIQYYDDYREIDGIKISFSQRSIENNITSVSKHTEIKNNIVMDDAIFNLPSTK